MFLLACNTQHLGHKPHHYFNNVPHHATLNLHGSRNHPNLHPHLHLHPSLHHHHHRRLPFRHSHSSFSFHQLRGLDTYELTIEFCADSALLFRLHHRLFHNLSE